jgi:hypothetical protein
MISRKYGSSSQLLYARSSLPQQAIRHTESLSNSSRVSKAIEAVKDEWTVVEILSPDKKAGQIGLPSSIPW